MHTIIIPWSYSLGLACICSQFWSAWARGPSPSCDLLRVLGTHEVWQDEDSSMVHIRRPPASRPHLLLAVKSEDLLPSLPAQAPSSPLPLQSPFPLPSARATGCLDPSESVCLETTIHTSSLLPWLAWSQVVLNDFFTLQCLLPQLTSNHRSARLLCQGMGFLRNNKYYQNASYIFNLHSFIYSFILSFHKDYLKAYNISGMHGLGIWHS